MPARGDGVAVIGELSEEPGKKTLLGLPGFGRDGTPLLRLRRRGSLRFGGDRLVASSAFRQGEMLLQRTDQDVAFTKALAQAADQFHLLGDKFGLLVDLLK